MQYIVAEGKIGGPDALLPHRLSPDIAASGMLMWVPSGRSTTASAH